MTTFADRRRQGIGGSDIDDVFSLPPYGCARKLFYEKTGAEADYELRSNDIDRGTAMEPLIIDMFSKKTGMRVCKIDDTIESDSAPWLQVHIDVFCNDGDQWFAVEVKDMRAEVFRKLKKEGMPRAYILQVQHELARCNMQAGYFVAHCCEYWGDILYFRVEADPELQAISDEAATRFWHSHVVANEPPTRLDVSDARCRRCQFRTTCQGEEFSALVKNMDAGEIEYAGESGVLFAEYFEAEARKEAAEAELEAIKDQIQQRIAAGKKGIEGPGGRAYRLAYTQPRLDNKAIEAAKPLLMAVLAALRPDPRAQKLTQAMTKIFTPKLVQITQLRVYPR